MCFLFCEKGNVPFPDHVGRMHEIIEKKRKEKKEQKSYVGVVVIWVLREMGGNGGPEEDPWSALSVAGEATRGKGF